MRARYEGRCNRCKQPILKGHEIEGEGKRYFHADCEKPWPEKKEIENPDTLASEKQMFLIAQLMGERMLRMGDASEFIDKLLEAPRREERTAA